MREHHCRKPVYFVPYCRNLPCTVVHRDECENMSGAAYTWRFFAKLTVHSLG